MLFIFTSACICATNYGKEKLDNEKLKNNKKCDVNIYYPCLNLFEKTISFTKKQEIDLYMDISFDCFITNLVASLVDHFKDKTYIHYENILGMYIKYYSVPFLYNNPFKIDYLKKIIECASERIIILKSCKYRDKIDFRKEEKIKLFCDVMLYYYYLHYKNELLKIMIYHEDMSIYFAYTKFKLTSKVVKINSNVSQKKNLQGLDMPKKHLLYFIKKRKYVENDTIYQEYRNLEFIQTYNQDKCIHISEKDNCSRFFTYNQRYIVFCIYYIFICGNITKEHLFMIIETVAAEICRKFSRNLILGRLFLPLKNDLSFLELHEEIFKSKTTNPYENLFVQIYNFFSFISNYFQFTCEIEFDSDDLANIFIDTFADYAEDIRSPNIIYQTKLSVLINEITNLLLINHNSKQLNALNTTKQVYKASNIDPETKLCDLDISGYMEFLENNNDRPNPNNSLKKVLSYTKNVKKQRLYNPHPKYIVNANNGDTEVLAIKFQSLYSSVWFKINKYLVQSKKINNKSNNIRKFHSDLRQLVKQIEVYVYKVDKDKTQITIEEYKKINEKFIEVFSIDIVIFLNEVRISESIKIRKIIINFMNNMLRIKNSLTGK